MTGDLSERQLAELARALLALDVPDECLPGVAANVAVLAGHARLLDPDLA